MPFVVIGPHLTTEAKLRRIDLRHGSVHLEQTRENIAYVDPATVVPEFVIHKGLLESQNVQTKTGDSIGLIACSRVRTKTRPITKARYNAQVVS
jgi:hypothetical protein